MGTPFTMAASGSVGVGVGGTAVLVAMAGGGGGCVSPGDVAVGNSVVVAPMFLQAAESNNNRISVSSADFL